MTRKLLPYEYDLIEQLNITKEEYLEFIAIQQAYTDPKEGTVFDVRNDAGTIVAIVLAVVGLLAQVVSILLTPRPPSMDGAGQRQTRNQRFSPRFGFNSQQDLAKYGDPVNLIYTDTSVNSTGGVRAATSLVWSAVRSYGSNQLVQLLFVLGGGKITAIDIDKSAFGQTPLADLISQTRWVYFKAQGTGALVWADDATTTYTDDPTFYGTKNNNPYRLQSESLNTRTDGFSQAYSPSTQNNMGLYGVVPINTYVYQRNGSGDKQAADLEITSSWEWKSLTSVAKDYKFTLTIKATNTDVNDVQSQAQEIRRNLASTFDDSCIFKLGSAVFRTVSVNVGTPDEKDMLIVLKCIEAGYAPQVDYSSKDLASDSTAYANSIKNSIAYTEAKKTVDSVLAEDERYTPSYIYGRAVISQNNQYTAAKIFEGNEQGVYKIRWVGRGGYQEQIYKHRDITQEEYAAYNVYKNLNAEIAAYQANDYFYTKALARIETASYQTLQACHIVDIAIKSKVYKNLSGRQDSYGSERRSGYPVSDNGYKKRTLLFLLKYKSAGKSFTYVPGIFAISRSDDIENFNYIKFKTAGTTSDDAKYWQFKLEPIVDVQAELSKHGSQLKQNNILYYYYIENSGNAVTITTSTSDTFQFTGAQVKSTVSGLPPRNENPTGLNEWDLFNLDADNQLRFSFDNGPELAITCISEQRIQAFKDFPNLYKNISMIGLNLFSGKNVQDTKSFTAFVTKGRYVKRLRTSGKDEQNITWGSTNYTYLPSAADGPTCFAPDIFLDTVLDTQDGIGNYAVAAAINIEQLARTKLFCEQNKLYMDGVIADLTSWREFWTQAAPYSLLEFARIGGQETLVPAIPYNRNTGKTTLAVSVSALFNQGNILEDSYKEEYLDYGSNVQDLIATVIYRDSDINGNFAINRSVEIKRTGITDADAIRQTFDISQFVTNRDQAVKYGKLLCNTRHYVRSAIEFRTFPTQDPLSPGAFIYVDIGQNNWDGIRTGTIGPSGNLNMPLDNTLKDGQYKFLLYKSGSGVVSKETTVTAGVASALASYDGYLFVLGTKVTSRRVFRISEVQMDEEGEITVRATVYPCDTSGNSLIADFSDSLFTVTSTLS